MEVYIKRGIENYITNQAAESLRPASTLGEHFGSLRNILENILHYLVAPYNL